MVDYEQLLNNKTIDKQQFLINYYHLININEAELVIILLIQNMLDNNELVTTQALENNMSINSSTIEVHLNKMIEKNILSFDNYSTRNSIDTSGIYTKIIDKLLAQKLEDNERKEKSSQVNLVSVFEKEFNRKLTPFEIDTIKEWSSTFNNELIVYALKESVMYGVLNFKYIEKIIIEQAKLLNG